MSQRILSRGLENYKYRSLYYNERYNENLKKKDDTNKDDSSREKLRDLTATNRISNGRRIEYKSSFGKSLLSSSNAKDKPKDKLKEYPKENPKQNPNENHVQTNLDTDKFFTELSNNKFETFETVDDVNNEEDDILKRNFSRINKIIEVENYFERVYGKNGVKGMTVEFYDLGSIKDTRLSTPKWILKDNSEELFEAELSPQDITVYNLWFYRSKDEGAPEFVQKGIKPIYNTDILSHLEKIYNVTREEKQRSGANRCGSKMIRLVLDELRKVNNYMLYIGSETRYPNNVMEKTPKLIEKLEKVLERIRLYKDYEKNKDLMVNIVNDEKAIRYAKELLYVAWMNFNVRTIEDGKNRVTFKKSWVEVNKELEGIIEKYFNRNNRNKKVGRRSF